MDKSADRLAYEKMKVRTSKRVKGFTLIEVLIAISVTALLLTAVAAALFASAESYSVNEDVFNATNPARLALLRITADIRSAQAVAVSEASTQCSLVTSAGSDITYSYDSSNDILYLITNDDTTDKNYVLCRNITDVTFSRTTVEGDSTAIKDVKISITSTSGSCTETISSAAVLRTNLY